mgnify:FL=1|tara:strand:- start:286 stop:552 length:267 start_codon:yes stop_codon:yes gene_type:complete
MTEVDEDNIREVDINKIKKYAPNDSNKICVWEIERKNARSPLFSGYLTTSNNEVFEVILWLNTSKKDKMYLNGDVKETNLRFVNGKNE